MKDFERAQAERQLHWLEELKRHLANWDSISKEDKARMEEVEEEIAKIRKLLKL